ncbi:hypothetical protein OPT61_g5031 [Boeremia exigua]|uniref:Uncharacterized protein n=1 Tax=Boeremia exigua TaxID=749465 RepID=A0ACC2IC09_9PLEO|nr:hypothetical protein OPT61_g5031 [Boeremia exigua]
MSMRTEACRRPLLQEKIQQKRRQTTRERYADAQERLAAGGSPKKITPPNASRVRGEVAKQTGRAGGGLEDIVDAVSGQRGALEVFAGADHFLHVAALLRSGEAERLFPHLLLGKGVVAKILLQPNQDDGDALAPLTCLLSPLVLDILKRVGRVDGKANEDDMCFASQLDRLAVYSAVCDIVFKDGGDVALCRRSAWAWTARAGTHGGEVAKGEDAEKTSLAAGSVADDD